MILAVLSHIGAKFVKPCVTKLIVAFACFFSPIHSAFACSSAICKNCPPTFLLVFAILVGLVSLITLAAWFIKRRFFRSQSFASPLLVATGLLALLLGIMGSFVIPEFSTVFESFGVDLPMQTKYVLAARQFLWLPALLFIGLWRVSKNWKKRRQCFVAVLFFETLMLLLVLQSLYSPIFFLGCVL